MGKILKQFQNIFCLFKPYWQYGKVFVIVSLVFWVVLLPLDRVLIVYFPSVIIDALNAGSSFGRIVLIALIFEIILMIIPMLEDVYSLCIHDRVQPRIDMNIKNKVYIQSLKTDYKYIDEPEYYDNYTWSINEYAAKSSDAFKLVNNFFSTLIVISTLISIISTISPWVIVITVINITLRTFAFFQINKLDIEKEDELVPRERRLGYLHRIFYLNQYAADLKSTNLKKYIFKRYDALKEEKIGIITKYSNKTIKWSIAADFVYRISEFVIVLFIAYGIYHGDIASVGLYMTLMLAVEQLNNHLYTFFELVRTGSKLSLYAEKIKKFFMIKSEIEDEEETKRKLLPNSLFSVELRNVSFSYENSNFSLSNLNLKINPGEKIAVVGENGVGKTTLVKLLLRLYDVTSGEILINGHPIKEYSVFDLRAHIGVAFQAPNIYAFSFAENIGLYNTVAEEKINEIAKQFKLDEVLAKNNADFSSELTREFNGDGIILSRGEAQKLGLARLMTNDFGLLLLDEPSSALAPMAEYEMNQLILGSGNRSTTLMISHRLSTIRNADKIVLIEDGKLMECGTHEELMEMGGKYYEMFTKQAENYLQ